LNIWKRAATRISQFGSEEERKVREQLDEYIQQLESNLQAQPEDDSVKKIDISELEEKVCVSLALCVSMMSD
jgi:predicted enzyme involved in methoxymalonyl-ACP biosynthesis